MAWCFEDEDDAYAERVFDHLNEAVAIVPAHFPLEVANVMLVAMKRGRIDQALADGFMAKLGDLPVDIIQSPPAVEMCFKLGLQYNLTSYDAAYLHLAMSRSLPLATNDGPLRRAARAARVALLTP